jgi:hypothetical protein
VFAVSVQVGSAAVGGCQVTVMLDAGTSPDA